jgi:HPt (histidine-containing phosphotransfer) domain-containing protein
MPDIDPSSLAEVLDQMWTTYLPQTHERVATLISAAQAFALGPLSATEQEEAQSAAHKLAGVLGTFGLPRGTGLARELEHIYSHPIAPSAELAAKLASMAEELRSIIESRK